MEEHLVQQRENLAAVGIEDAAPETLADRMKLYESVYSDRLDPDLPIIVRVDGKNFSKYTKLFQKPFDMMLVYTMQHCMERLADELQGFKLAYHQSDEISFLITKKLTSNSEVAFGGKVNKINSLCASYMSGYFNKYMADHTSGPHLKRLAFFDCRCFNVPHADVSNYFLHRAKDWKRNSITMLGREHFSQKEMHKKNSSTVKLELLLKKDVSWNNLVDELKYGTFMYKGLNGFVKKHMEAKYTEIDKFVKEVCGTQE